MPRQADFGWRPGFSQLGSYKPSSGGLAYIYALTGMRWNPDGTPSTTPGTLWAWINADGPYTELEMITAYEPSIVNAYPVRGAVRGGDGCSFPSIEADALVAAGIATYA